MYLLFCAHSTIIQSDKEFRGFPQDHCHKMHSLTEKMHYPPPTYTQNVCLSRRPRSPGGRLIEWPADRVDFYFADTVSSHKRHCSLQHCRSPLPHCNPCVSTSAPCSVSYMAFWRRKANLYVFTQAQMPCDHRSLLTA